MIECGPESLPQSSPFVGPDLKFGMQCCCASETGVRAVYDSVASARLYGWTRSGRLTRKIRLRSEPRSQRGQGSSGLFFTVPANSWGCTAVLELHGRLEEAVGAVCGDEGSERGRYRLVPTVLQLGGALTKENWKHTLRSQQLKLQTGEGSKAENISDDN